MHVKEYRILLPMTVEEYQIAQLFSVARASKENTGGGEGVVVLNNESFSNKRDLFKNYSSGQYTHKLFKLQSKVPGIIRKIAPKGAMEIHEEAWNAYPYCKTVINNPDYMKEKFLIQIESLHVSDRGEQDNVFGLSNDQLKKRDVVYIDIANDTIPTNEYKAEEDPKKFLSKKTGRGQLKSNWTETQKPIMCAYKLVSVEFKWFGLQTKIEKFIQTFERKLFSKFNRQLFCWIDEWHDLNMDDIRRIENEVAIELKKQIDQGQVRGDTMKEDEDD